MKKTLNINLSGLAFTIDEDAYQSLKNYLDTLRRHFNYSEGSEEIMDDIEARIAELMQEKLDETKTVIGLQDIEEIIAQMGSPEDYMEEDSFADEPKYQHSSTASGKMKKLYRDEDNAIIGGVAAGVGHFFGIQPLWFRLALILAFIFWGTGILLYIILWIVMPKAKTTAEKLEMKGEPVNVSNIGKKVEDELKNVNQKLREDDALRNAGSSIGAFIERIGNFILRIIELAIKAFGKIIGILMLFAGGVACLAIITVFTALVSGAAINIGDAFGYSYNQITPLFFANSWDAYLVLIGAFLTFIVPVLAILYGGVSLATSYKNIPKGIGWGLAGSWVMGIILLFYSVAHTGSQFSQRAEVKTVHTLDFEGDTLFLTLNEASIEELSGPKILSENQVNFHYDEETDVISLGDIELGVNQSKKDFFSLTQYNSSRGNVYNQAEKRAEGIMYQFKENDNTVSFNSFYSFQKVDKWRNQKIDLTLNIPIGKTIYLEANMIDFIYDIKNVTNTYDDYMVGHYWTMTKNGLESPDFTSKDDETSVGGDEFEVDIKDNHVEIDL
jgi:phage shock protein PspC (stress-responsive transcriptional regulator)